MEPVFVTVKDTVTTGSCSQGSSEEPGPSAWRVPPAVEPLILRLEYEKVV